MISPSSSSLLLPPPPPPLTLPTVATTNSTLEVLQEGWYFILINKLTLYECWYQVFSDGTLVFRMNTDIIYKFAISNIHFKLFDASSSLPTGCGLMLSYNSQDYYFIFDHILDMKRFCFSCYRTAEGTNLQEIFSQMHWLRESSDLKVDLFPKKKSSVKSYLQSFLRISGTDLSSHPSSNSQYLQSNEESPEILPESQGNSNPVSKKNFDYDKIFRRLSSMNSDKDTSFRTQSNDQPSQNEDISPPNRSSLLSPIFISSALFQLSNSKSSHIPQEQSFYNGTIQLFRSGTLIVNYERLINTELPDNDESGIQSYSQKLSRSYSCQKILCLKYDPHKDQDISQIGLILRIFSTKLEEDNLVRRPTPLIKPMTKETTNLKNNDYEDIILIFPTLQMTKSFLQTLSCTVPIHNILGFLIDMGWVAPIVDDETISTALNRADVDSVVAEQIEKYELEVCIPETIPEEENESRDNSMVDAVETLECKDSSGPPQPSLTTRVIRQLSSSDAYSGLEPGEDGDNFRAQNASSQLSRKSRFSRLFGSTKEPSEGSSSSKTRKVTSGFFGNFTSDSNKSILDDSDAMKEKFPGFKYRSNSQILTNETNLSIIDEMDDIPPQQVAPGRYTTLKQIIGTMDSNSNSNLSEAGDIKGIKGTKIEPLVSGGITQATASARARERLPDGLGAIIGGVLFEKLIVKKVEFTPRYLELKLVDIMPLPINKSEQYLKPLNANKITPFRELISGTNNLSYDRHLILDGVDFSREKHIEILIRVLDLPIEKSVEMLKDWVSKSIEQATSDIPDHWEDFITNNSTVFSQKIRELKEQITDNRSSPPLLSIDSSYPRDSSPRSNNSNSKNSDEDSFIQHLDLRYCQITNRGISLLVHSLRANEKLKTLNLTGNMINRDSAAASLGNMLNFNSSLLEINLQETNLGDTGATLVAQALHINLTLQKLSLSGNNITSKGCAMISMSLEENTSLLQLNLSRNCIGIDGAKWISKFLYLNKSLTCLDLNRQQLKGKFGSDGAKYLSRCLRMNNTLRILRIGRNRIGFEGARYLSGMLLLNRGLRILDISHSKIGVEGSIQLANSLLQNNSLQSLLLANRLLPVCYLKGVHDSDYYLRQSIYRFSYDQINTNGNTNGNHQTTTTTTDETDTGQPTSTSTDNIATSIEFDQPSYYLDDDVYHANDSENMNCDIAYDCQEKSFEKIDMQILFASKNIPTASSSSASQGKNNFDEWTTETFSNSFGTSKLPPHGTTTEEEKSIIDLEVGMTSPPTSMSKGESNSTTSARIIRPLAITDEESVLIAHLLRGNNLIQELRLEHTFLPIQLLRGRSLTSHNGHIINQTIPPTTTTPTMKSITNSSFIYSLDLSNSNLVSSDATIIGVLIAENPYLRTICLKGNYFNKTDGETWIANAINKNPNIALDTNIWSAEEMFADGYHQLAALKGVSVSGAAIEPQRLNTLSDKALVICTGIGYYLDVISDIYVTYLYSLNPELEIFLPWTVLIICLPTFMTLGSILWTTCSKHPCRAILQILIVIFQLHPLLHIYESILMEIETTALLDAKFLEGIYEAIPQILLQTYIMFLLSTSSGTFQYPIFISLLISILTVSGVLVMVVDRGKIRQITLGPRRKNPWFVRYLAHGLAVLFEGEKLCGSNKFGTKSHEGMKELIHYSSYTYSHYVWAILFHFTTLVVRLIAITWLLVVVGSYKFVVFLIIFFSRICILFFLDPKAKHRSFIRNFFWCLCYCLITGVWEKDERSPISSRRAYFLLNILDTIESTVFICYAAFLSKNSQMKFIHGLLTFAAVIICRAISWVLIMTWQIPVHYTELQTEDKLKSTCYDRAIFRLCSRDTHTFFHDIVSRVDTPVIPIPEVYSTNGEKKIIKDRPKSWWSSEERSASLELSYITAVVDSKLVLFSNPEGVAIKHSPSPHSTPRSDETKSDGNRERSRARDWDTMPEVIKKSKGRFHLHGGKNLYTDMDLANNLERHRALTRRTRRGFSGWNRHSAASTTGTTSAISSSKNISDDGQMIDMQNQSQLPLKGIKKLPRDSTQIHYNDFIPSKISPKLPFSAVSSDSTSEDAIVQVTKVKDLNQSKNDNEDTMIWEINPSLA